MKVSHFLSEPSHVREHASKGHRPCDEGHRGRQEQKLRRSSQALRTRGRVLPARHQVRGPIRKGQSLHQSQMCKSITMLTHSFNWFCKLSISASLAAVKLAFAKSIPQC